MSKISDSNSGLGYANFSGLGESYKELRNFVLASLGRVDLPLKLLRYPSHGQGD